MSDRSMGERSLRYVILRHEVPPGQARKSHWDLMIEWDGDDLLLTWELPSLPTSGQHLPAQPLAPHRRRYLDYEGTLSKGRGSVTRWDAGHYLMVGGERIELAHCQLRASRGQVGLRESTGIPGDIPGEGPTCFRLRLDGKRLQGELTLRPPTGVDQFWNVSFVGNIAVR